MTQGGAAHICKERFARWTNDMAKDIATPVIAIGVCHEPAPSGQLSLCVVDDPAIDNPTIAAFLRRAADLIDGKA